MSCTKKQIIDCVDRYDTETKAEENYKKFMKFKNACEKAGKDVGLSLGEVYKVFDLVSKYTKENEGD